MRIDLNKLPKTGLEISGVALAILLSVLAIANKDTIVSNPIINNANVSNGYAISLNNIENNYVTTTNGTKLEFDSSIGVGFNDSSIIIPSGGTIKNKSAINGISEILTNGLSSNLIVSYGWAYDTYKDEQCLLSSSNNSTTLYDLKPSYFEIKNSSGSPITLSTIDICYSCSSSSETSLNEYPLSYSVGSNEVTLIQLSSETCNNIKKITVPDYYHNLPVTKAVNNAFQGCDKLTEFVGGKYLTSLGEFALSYCKSLTSVKFRNINQLTIGQYCFTYSTNSELVIELPKTIKSIGKYSFRKCSTSLTLKVAYSLEEAQTAWDKDWVSNTNANDKKIEYNQNI